MLKRLFIKDYKNVEDTNVRNSYGKVAGIFGIILNLLLGVIKLVVGLISGSVSIMADAVNNITDSATSVLTLIGFKLSSKKPTKKHPYGYARYEYVASFVIALLMLLMGGIFLKESITKIVHPEEITINIATIIILAIAVLGKLYQMYVYNDFAKAIKSDTLKASAIDSRNDVISTIAILIAMIVMKIFNINIDAYLGLAVSAFVIYSSIKMIIETLQPLIGIVPTEEQVKEIVDKIMSYDGVLGIHDLVIHNYGVNNDFVTVHVEFDANMDVVVAHDMMDIIEADFKKNNGIQLTIHMDPIVIGNPEIDDLKEKIKAEVLSINKDLLMHDFRAVEGKTHTNVLFDVVVPLDVQLDHDEFIKHLSDKFSTEKFKYHFIVDFDTPYVN